MSPATSTDRLLAIQALASVQCVAKASCIEQHAGVIARLLDAEDPETIENVFSEAFGYPDAVRSLAFDCRFAEEALDPRDSGAWQDRDSGVWNDDDKYCRACEDARETAADQFLQMVRTGIAKDLYALTPHRVRQIAAQDARIAAAMAHVGALS